MQTGNGIRHSVVDKGSTTIAEVSLASNDQTYQALLGHVKHQHDRTGACKPDIIIHACVGSHLRARHVNVVEAAILTEERSWATLQHDAGEACFMIGAHIMKCYAGCLAAISGDGNSCIAQ